MSYRGADPTDVMGRRIAAYLLDSLIATIIFLLLAWPVLFGSTRTAPADSFSCVDETPTVVDGHEPPSLCFQIGDTVRYVPNHKVAGFRLRMLLLSSAVTLVTQVLIQGLAGGSPAKLLLGLRVVRPDGTDAGPLRCLVRTVLLPVDSFCCGFLPGLPLASRSQGHRRLGDMAAQTMVIGRDDQIALILARSGVALPDRTTLAAQAWSEDHRPEDPSARADQIVIPAAYQAPDPFQPAPPPPPPSGAQPSAAPTGTDPWAPSTVDPAGGADPSHGGGPALGAADPSPAGPAPEPAGPPAGTSSPRRVEAARSADGPSWDDRRNTYVQFDPELAMWMQWDEPTRAWVPLRP